MKTIFSTKSNSLHTPKLQKLIRPFKLILICAIFTITLFSCTTLPDPPSDTTQEDAPLIQPIEVEPVLPEETDEQAIADPVEPTVKKGPLEISVIPEEYYTGRYHYSVELPTFADYTDLTNMISECIQNRFTEFDTLSAENYQARLDTMTPAEHKEFEKATETLHSFFVQWDHGELSHDFISIKIETFQYVGGANEMIFIDTFNWYPTQNRLLTIEDIPSYAGIHYPNTIWLDYLSNNSRSFLENKINRNKDSVISDIIYQGTEPQLKNFEHFTLKGNNITLWFEKHQVASGSFGTLFITLPLEN